ncbi:TPA: hypothetical protein N0F65_004076 [Lagenidium giganteum]|uniref:ANK_REP_REGION domain-containing protein n=1 Tax=Lagenidium giganteum TaxID=4803 RepID=A0AAV2Z219_9STRA|nr:TPA: hypothetical protein N0F65_004076 [Lagenidium giganteum]
MANDGDAINTEQQHEVHAHADVFDDDDGGLAELHHAEEPMTAAVQPLARLPSVLSLPTGHERPTSSAKPPSAAPSSRRVAMAGPLVPIGFHRLNPQQVQAVLKQFWADLLQNSQKKVRKCLAENYQKMDFNSARYTPNAEGTAVHLCAQYGFLAMAKMLVVEYGLDINAQNKVGSTPLHVACKFNHASMVSFLLERNAQLDIPDLQRRVAFDVALYPLLDQCVLQPLRKIEAQALAEKDQLVEANGVARVEHAKAQTWSLKHGMALADLESHHAEQAELLRATSKVDAYWGGLVQKARDELAAKQYTYRRCKDQLEAHEEDFRTGVLVLLREAEELQRQAQATLVAQQQEMRETEAVLAAKLKILDDQYGLLETAETFPYDPELQIWLFETMLEMVRQAATATHDDSEAVIEVEQLLLRQPTFAAIQGALVRLRTNRAVLWHALQALVVLCEFRTRTRRSELVVHWLLHWGALEALRGCITQFPDDLALATVALRAMSDVMRSSSASDIKRVVAFCQTKENRAFALTYVGHPDADSALREYASYVCFVTAKYNARRTLLDNEASIVAVDLLLRTDWQPDESADINTMQWLLSLLTLLHSPLAVASPTRRARRATGQQAPMLEQGQERYDAFWQQFSASELLNKVLSTFTPTTCHLANSVVQWLFHCLRHLCLHNGPTAQRLRQQLQTTDSFELVASAITDAIDNQAEGADRSSRKVVCAGIDLLQTVFIERFTDEGQVQPCDTFVLDFTVELLGQEGLHLSDGSPADRAAELTRLTEAIALLLSDGNPDQLCVCWT